MRPYTDSDRALDLRWWAAANYLTVAEIYLRSNPLLREPLTVADIKPRLLGHWGTGPGLSMIYALLNRLIRATETNCPYVAGPGYGGPAVLANPYLEGTYSELYPAVSADAGGMTRFVRQFSSPGGVPSHVGVQTPGSIHEGGEFGYALVHAAGAALDHPDLLVACVVGDGEAETGPLAASWKLSAFLNARRDGAVLPILHLNGYKISGPTVLGRMPYADVVGLLAAQGWDPVVISGDDPPTVFAALYAALVAAHERIAARQARARSAGPTPDDAGPGGWLAIVLRTPKGWTGPEVVDGVKNAGTFRSHQVPLSGVRERAAPRPHPGASRGPAGDPRLGLAPVMAPGSELTVPALNPGSSSLKLAVRGPGIHLRSNEDRLAAGGVAEAIANLKALLGERGIRPDAVAHRVVHGGPDHHTPTRVDESLLADLRAAVPMAPLHLPQDLAAIAAAQRHARQLSVRPLDAVVGATRW